MSGAKVIKKHYLHKSIKLLNEYKSLLDSGIITQEEFYEKKQKLLKR